MCFLSIFDLLFQQKIRQSLGMRCQHVHGKYLVNVLENFAATKLDFAYLVKTLLCKSACRIFNEICK